MKLTLNLRAVNGRLDLELSLGEETVNRAAYVEEGSGPREILEELADGQMDVLADMLMELSGALLPADMEAADDDF